MNQNQPHPQQLQVIIRSPDETVWEGNAQSISSINSAGPFDILYSHANFITIIQNKPIIVRTANENLEFNFYTAVILTESNVVKIFAHL